jgi:hypothetical protein
MADGASFELITEYSRIPEVIVGLQAAVNAGLSLWAQAVITLAQAQCPVETGTLRDSAYSQVEAGGVTLGFSAPYAAYVDQGHHTRSGSWVPANPFFSSAIQALQDQVGPMCAPAIQALVGA